MKIQRNQEQPTVDSWDYWCKDEIVCPHCGVEFGDSWELLPRDPYETLIEDVECDECGELFDVELEYSVTYTSIPRKQDEEAEA